MTHLLGNILVLYLVVLKIISGSLLLFFMLPRLQGRTLSLMDLFYFPLTIAPLTTTTPPIVIIMETFNE